MFELPCTGKASERRGEGGGEERVVDGEGMDEKIRKEEVKNEWI